MKKFAIIGVLAVFAMSLMGFGFAKWSQSVNAEITVKTGGIALGIRDVGTNDDGGIDSVADYNALGGDPQYNYDNNSLINNDEMKNVASKVSANNGDSLFSVDGVDYYGSVTETIDNGYPYYGPTTVLKIASGGTVPVKIEELIATTSGDLDVANNHFIGTWKITKSWVSGEITGTGQADLLTALKGIQLHKDYVITIEMVEYIHQSAKQNATGSINWQIKASQWNEVL